MAHSANQLRTIGGQFGLLLSVSAGDRQLTMGCFTPAGPRSGR